MEEYIQLKKEMRAQTSDTTFAGLTEEILRLEKELRKSDEELAAFQGTNSVEVFQEQGNGAAKYLGGLNQRLAGLKSEYDLLQSLSLEQNLEHRKANAVISMPDNAEGIESGSAGGDSDYLKAKQQILLLKADEQELTQYLRPKHPKLIALKEDIGRREKALAIFQQQSAEKIESRKGSMALQIANLEKEMQAWETKALGVSRKNAEYQKLKTNSQRVQALYDRLLATMQTLDLNKQINPESVMIMERATPALPQRASFSKQLLLGTLIGLGLSIAVLMFLERLDDRITSISDLQELFGEEVLGQVPREKSRGNRRAIGLIEPEDEPRAFVEAYRGLRSSLLFLSESKRRHRTLVVTSSVPNEGKSLTAANLAIIMANAGSRVLLVDADLRKGGLHELFGHEAGPGLTEVLGAGLTMEETVRETRFSNLWLLGRGGNIQASSELLVSKALEAFLQDTSGIYDYVILDTAPVLATDDATSLAPHVDGVLFLIRAEETSTRVARAALDLLYQRGANVLGLVFNAVHPGSGDFLYYQYEDYYQTSAH
jgi:capsular exopolysaccharide synthesis family protein